MDSPWIVLTYFAIFLMLFINFLQVVRCKGGSQNSEGDPLLENRRVFRIYQGVLVVPLLENRKVTEFPFHVFDRYEIHIQDFQEQFTGIFIMFRSPSPEFQNFKFENVNVSKTSKSKYVDFKKNVIAKCTKLKNVFRNFKISKFQSSDFVQFF